MADAGTNCYCGGPEEIYPHHPVLVCDFGDSECTENYPGLMGHSWPQLRAEAHSQGWTYRRVDGRMRDLCPDHSSQLDAERGGDEPR